MAAPALGTTMACEELLRRRLASGVWGYSGRAQPSVEATCLVVLALKADGSDTTAQATAMRSLLQWQNPDGSWPAFLGDREGCWTTALALSVLNTFGDGSGASDRALHWLLDLRGREGHWFWSWKFKLADRSVRLNPHKSGWPWTPGTNSWVVPTAFSLIALKQFAVCKRSDLAERRIGTGVEMLMDRACIGGGWNAGNNVVFGQPLAPHAEPTAIGLLAVQDEPRTAVIEQSLDWLRRRAEELQAASSLGWAILALFEYQERIQWLQERLFLLVGDGTRIRNNATLAVAVLALRCGETIHPFAVTR